MSEEARLYCRFCAEEKSYSEITALTTQEEINSLLDKLAHFGIYFVDFTNKMLPETVCINCYELLNLTYEFFAKVQRSQVVLGELYETHYKTEIKVERNEDKEISQDGNSSSHDDVLMESDTNDEVVRAGSPLPTPEEIPKKIPNVEKNKTNKFKSKYIIPTWSDYPAICKFCNSKMDQQRDLTKHCIKFHKKCFGNKCVDCSLDVPSFKEFVEHVKTHHPKLNEICQYCDIQIGDMNSDHVDNHTKIRHACSTCGKVFHKMRDLRVHLSKIEHSQHVQPLKKRPQGQKEKNSTCKVCGLVMKTTKSVKAHLLTHTDRKRDHTCDRCGKTFYTSSSLKTHWKIHDSNFNETCRICQRTFITLTRLKKHVKTHNLEMEFQCDQCKKFFSTKDRLREHVRVHMDFKPYQCKYCPKRFKFANIMKTHEHQHTGDRPFICGLCGREFANWSNCNKHMKRKHAMTMAKTVKTPHGNIAVNPTTGLPEMLKIDEESKKWTQELLKG